MAATFKSTMNTVNMILCAIIVLRNVTGEEYITEYQLITLPRLLNFSQHQTIVFQASNIEYSLRLISSFELVTKNTLIKVISDQGVENIDNTIVLSRNYIGKLNGDQNSYVSGSIDEDGIFEGFFMSTNETVYIESSARYWPKNMESHNAILYNSSSILKCSDNNKNFKRNPCNSLQRTGRLKRHASVPPEILSLENSGIRAEAIHMQSIVCDLKVVTDFRFAEHVGRCDKTEILTIVLNHLKWIDNALRQMDFSNDNIPENAGFHLASLEIHMGPLQSSYADLGDEWNPRQFVAEFSNYKFHDYCAGFLFTYYQMEPDSEEFGPSLFRSTLEDNRGLCSNYTALSLPVEGEERPEGVDYGIYFSNALPINFRYKDNVATDQQIHSELLHQVAHLFQAPDDDHCEDEVVQLFASESKAKQKDMLRMNEMREKRKWKRQVEEEETTEDTPEDQNVSEIEKRQEKNASVTYAPPKPAPVYATSYPLTDGGGPLALQVSPCALQRMMKFFKSQAAKCLRICYGGQCWKTIERPNNLVFPKTGYKCVSKWKPPKTTSTTPIFTTFGDWTEVCVILPISLANQIAPTRLFILGNILFSMPLAWFLS